MEQFRAQEEKLENQFAVAINKVLTPRQRAMFKKMLGAPFDRSKMGAGGPRVGRTGREPSHGEQRARRRPQASSSDADDDDDEAQGEARQHRRLPPPRRKPAARQAEEPSRAPGEPPKRRQLRTASPFTAARRVISSGW